VVAGIRTPHPISSLRKRCRKSSKDGQSLTRLWKYHYRRIAGYGVHRPEGQALDAPDRTGKRTGLAAIRIGVEMVEEGLITRRKP
jgi:pyruvate,orthophosphate dikinase